jgi:hypothetical protein
LSNPAARAQSTCILAACRPDARIVSIELTAGSADAAEAERRMKAFSNICPLFGDARRLLPLLVLPSDVVLIDGPKRFRAVRLALRLLATGKPDVVFIHDMRKGAEGRAFLERHLPETLYSDDAEFVERFKYLDGPASRDQEIEQRRRPQEGEGAPRSSYGPTLACIFRRPSRRYRALILGASSVEFGSHLARSMRRRIAALLGRSETA